MLLPPDKFNEIPYTKPLQYAQILQSHITMAERIEGIANSKQSHFIETIANQSTAEMRALVARLFGALSDYDDATEIGPGLSIAKMLEDHRKQETLKAQSYPRIITNQALLLMCTSLDTYLQDCLLQILKTENNVVKELSDKSDLTVYDAIDMNKPAMISKIHQRIIDRFDRPGLEAKLKIFVRAGFDHDEILSLKHMNKARRKTAEQGLALITEIYQKRNEIAHRGANPLTDSTELKLYANYMSDFITNMAMLCKEQYSVLMDLELVKQRFGMKVS